MAALASLAAGFAGGIFLRSLISFGWLLIVCALLPAALSTAGAYVSHRRIFVLSALFFFAGALGAARMQLADTPLPQAFLGEVGKRVSYEAIVVSDPDVRDANQRIEVAVSENGAHTRMLAIAPRYPRVEVGDTVRVSGTLAVPQPFSSDDEGGRVFKYDRYLQKSGIRFLLNFASVRVEQQAPWWSVLAGFARVKHAFLSGLGAVLPEPYASLAGGIVIGGKQGLGADLLAAFVLAGLVQVVVLSGYNVMVVAEWVMRGLGRFKLSRTWSAVSGGLALLVFVLIAGAGSASIRAALMALIALYARATGRSYAASRALLTVMLLMLVWNPLLFAFDPGFDLSVLATAGIIWLSPLIELKLARLGAFWANAVATTVAAQMAVLPLLLYQTGTLSLVAIPANLLTLPVVPAAMGFSAIAGFAGMLFGSTGFVLAIPAYFLNAYIVWVARVSAALPLAAFHLPAFSFVITVIAYVLLAVIAVRAYKKNAAGQGPAAPDPFGLTGIGQSAPPASAAGTNGRI